MDASYILLMRFIIARFTFFVSPTLAKYGGYGILGTIILRYPFHDNLTTME